MSRINQPMLLISATFMLIISLSSRCCVDGSIGITWGRQSVTNLVPSVVVDLLLQNQIKHVKLFNSDPSVIKAFGGTDIEVDLTIANSSIIADENAIRQWINRTIDASPRVNFRYISVGNNAFTLAYNTKRPYTYYIEGAKLLQSLLDERGYGDKMKAVITHTHSGVLTQNNSLPSQAEFTPEIREAMVEILRFNEQSGTPFIYENYPVSQIANLQLDFNFVFSNDNSSLMIMDQNRLVYMNLFDLVHDSFIWALRKIGYNNTKIIVGSIGFPTDGVQGATVEAAEKYWKFLLPRVASNRGTPLQPGVTIDIFVHSLADERKNLGTYSRHWGVYWANGRPKYKIDLTGQGRDIFPSIARGLYRMPARWCVFNEDMTDPQKVKEQFNFACKDADCTSLTTGGSCGNLTYVQNVSYAFNAYFQSRFQNEKACMFKSLGRVVNYNPSQGSCIFSIDVVRGTQPVVILSYGDYVLKFGADRLPGQVGSRS